MAKANETSEPRAPSEVPPTDSRSTSPQNTPANSESAGSDAATKGELEKSTYEIIRHRLESCAADLRGRLEKLNTARRDVFGSIPTKLLATERITTANNCVPRDMVPIGDQFIFGYNVHIGLKTETLLEDVFAVHRFAEQTFHEQPLTLLHQANFEHDFKQLYKYYKNTRFAKFLSINPHVYMVFQVGKSAKDIKAFKWLREESGLRYLDNRSDHEVRYPAQHEFQWTRTHRDLHRFGQHPHVSIEDIVFVETVGGDLTVKVEDNTSDGAGIYSEPVEDPDQTLDDAEIYYAVVGNIVLLKIRPYKEQAYRYLVYNRKIQRAMRLDAIEQACLFLPEDHGIIFSNGYYLQTGEYKQFESSLSDLVFERRISSANGEDFLYVFHHPESGDYVLLSYNMISQKVDAPIHCNGFSLFDNGQLAFFRVEETAQKHHALQIWQTPYVREEFQVSTKKDSELYRIGNRDIVRGMSECHSILNLIDKDDSYANLYVDLVKFTTDVLDSYFWLGQDEAFQLAESLKAIRETAKTAVDEFEKVVRVRRATKEKFSEVAKQSTELAKFAATRRYEKIDDYVETLSKLRAMRGQVIGLRELRYVNLDDVQTLEKEIEQQFNRLSRQAVDFLLRDDSLLPYAQRVAAQNDAIAPLTKVTEAKSLEEQIAATGAQLELLIDIVSNLKIDDATQRTRIIDSIQI
jgi:ATPase involved in DNA repair